MSGTLHRERVGVLIFLGHKNTKLKTKRNQIFQDEKEVSYIVEHCRQICQLGKTAILEGAHYSSCLKTALQCSCAALKGISDSVNHPEFIKQTQTKKMVLNEADVALFSFIFREAANICPECRTLDCVSDSRCFVCKLQ